MGAINLRLPTSLHAELRELAEKEGVSLNQLLVIAAAEKAAHLRHAQTQFDHRVQRGSRERFLAALAQVPDGPPVEGDELA